MSGCASRPGSSSRGGAPARRVYELLPVIEGQGLCRLPEPSPGDIFLDLEGDPFVGTAGSSTCSAGPPDRPARPAYHTRWAFDPAAEKAAFEAFIDLVMDALAALSRACTSITSRPTSRPRSSA